MNENNRMLQEILEGAQGLHKSGVIDMRRLQEYEVICTPAPKFTGEDVKTFQTGIIRLHLITQDSIKKG